MDAAIQQHRGVLPISHTELVSAGDAGEHDLSRRCPPGELMSLAPAEATPIDASIEGWSTIVANAGSHARCALRSRTVSDYACKSGSSAAATGRSSATSTLKVRHAAPVSIGSSTMPAARSVFRSMVGMARIERPRPSKRIRVPPCSTTGARLSWVTSAALATCHDSVRSGKTRTVVDHTGDTKAIFSIMFDDLAVG